MPSKENTERAVALRSCSVPRHRRLPNGPTKTEPATFLWNFLNLFSKSFSCRSTRKLAGRKKPRSPQRHLSLPRHAFCVRRGRQFSSGRSRIDGMAFFIFPFTCKQSSFNAATQRQQQAARATGGRRQLLLLGACTGGGSPQAPGSSAGRASNVRCSSKIEKQRLIVTLETLKSIELQAVKVGRCCTQLFSEFAHSVKSL